MNLVFLSRLRNSLWLIRLFYRPILSCFNIYVFQILSFIACHCCSLRPRGLGFSDGLYPFFSSLAQAIPPTCLVGLARYKIPFAGLLK
jgi:hypothetical protein